MSFFNPLKLFECIWDRIEKSKVLPKWLKSLLLSLMVITMMLAYVVGLILLMDRSLTDISLAYAEILFARQSLMMNGR